MPRNFKGKQSKDAWSSCGSCHPDGLADGVTWIFGTGPRQTKPLDGMFNKGTNMSDAGLLNWSAIRGSNTDFNANSRGVQGGCGFASDDFAPGQCFAKGARDAGEPRHLRPRHHPRGQRGPRRADLVDLFRRAAAESAAAQQCGGRAGGLRGQLRLLPRGGQVDEEPDLPPRQPRRRRPERGALGPRRHQARAGAAGGTVPANEFFSFTCNALTIKYLEDVGTFDVTNPLEIRDNAAASTAFGVNGFNVPSLLSINYHAPYLHRGQAQTLEDVFPLHALGPAAGVRDDQSRTR